MGWEVISRGENHALAAVRSVLISLYWGKPDMRSLQDRGPWANKVVDEFGSLGQVTIIDRNTTWGMPSAQWRELSRQQSKNFEELIDFSAVVIEPDSISGALVRTLARGVASTLALDRRFRVSFFDDVETAFEHAQKMTKSGARAYELQAALNAVRPDFAARTSGGSSLG